MEKLTENMIRFAESKLGSPEYDTTEAARACKKYAFDVLRATEVCSIIRDTNIPSQNVAVRNGMKKKDTWIKHYRGMDMLHYRYVVCL